MITEAYCSFEVAKLMNEKGFEVVCDWYYPKNGGEIEMLDLYERNYCMESFISAPTHQMAMAWLREEHNIYVCPKLRCFRGSKKNDKPYFEWEDSVLRLPSSNQLHPHALEICKHYQTYEQAVEAALLYVLQNLIKKGDNNE